MATYSHGNPTNDEQYLLELLNRARADPLKEAALQGIDLQEGTVKPIPSTPGAPLPFNEQLLAAAQDFAQELTETGGTPGDPHTDKNGDGPKKRIQKHGYLGKNNGFLDKENISHDYGNGGAEGAVFAHAGLFLDPGVPDVGHRRAMLGDFDEVGVGARSGPKGGKVVQDFVLNNLVGPNSPNPNTKRPKFILGVVCVGSDGVAYTPGNGIPGVKVTLSQGTWDAKTSASGGYAIPADGLSGAITVTFDRQGVKKTRAVDLKDANVKVDCQFPSLVGASEGPLGNVIDTSGRFWKWVRKRLLALVRPFGG
jgi:serralysin